MQSGKTPPGTGPLTARSVLASALLGEDPPELGVGHLVRLAALFGINENRARVALSRMAAAGEVTAEGSGRYRLGGRLLARQDRQAESLRGHAGPWDGTWRIVVVTASGQSAAERIDRRRRLELARLAQFREGVWLRPANLDLRPDPGADAGASLFTGVPDGDPVELAATHFDLVGWAARAEHLLDALAESEPSTPADLAPGFALSAAVLRHLQADPLLPAELLPVTWAGAHLRTVYEGWDRAYRQVLRQWGRSA